MGLLKRKKTVADFVNGLQLDKHDHQRLIEHIQEHASAAVGPSLDSPCNQHFRDHLLSNLPPMGHEGVSWNGLTKLKDALDQGFTSKKAYEMGIPAIGIVAVLVANVAFVAWVQVPGGSNPYWLGCDYPLFTGFLIANGIAFIMSVAAVVVITAFPLVLSRTPHQAAWWGGILLMISLLAFILAFLLAGFVTVNYNAPPASCSNLQCTQGGIKCSFSVSLVSEYAPDLNSSAIVYTGDADSTFFVMDANVAGLNSVSNSSRGAVCLTYNRSVSNGPMSSTLYPWSPTPSDQGGSNLASQQAIQQLLTDPTVQRQTVCMDVSDFPSAIDPALSLNSFAVDVNFDIQDLGDYLNVNDVDVKTILPNNSAVKLHSFSTLQYFCLHQIAQESMRFDVLCDTASQTETGNFSVTQSGGYISAITAANSGAVLFDANITAVQVSRAIKALAGCFSCICLVITVFLVKSKWF